MKPEDIERKSMAIIDGRAPQTNLSPAEYRIARRMVHTTADFNFFENVRFHPRAVAAGLEALAQGRSVAADTNMLKAGLTRLPRGVEVVVRTAEEATRQEAARLGLTRSAMAMRRSVKEMEGGIVAIGNAPTALLEVIRMVREGQASPGLIVGLPVGFVMAAESKEELLGLDCPYITAVGEKGGSPVAAAVLNALALLLDRAKD